MDIPISYPISSRVRTCLPSLGSSVLLRRNEHVKLPPAPWHYLTIQYLGAYREETEILVGEDAEDKAISSEHVWFYSVYDY